MDEYERDQRSMEREVRADKKKGLKIGVLVQKAMDIKTKALMVIAATPHIRAYLKANDPMALKQVEQALGKDKPTKKTHPKTFAPDWLDRIVKNPKAVDKLNKQLEGMGIQL